MKLHGLRVVLRGLGGLGLVFLSARSLIAASGDERSLPRLDELPRFSARFSVEEAYAAIPHRRTVFRFERSAIDGPERAYLRLMFEVIDLAVVARVSAYQTSTMTARIGMSFSKGCRFLRTSSSPESPHRMDWRATTPRWSRR